MLEEGKQAQQQQQKKEPKSEKHTTAPKIELIYRRCTGKKKSRK
jgi:hypothetical protein